MGIAALAPIAEAGVPTSLPGGVGTFEKSTIPGGGWRSTLELLRNLPDGFSILRFERALPKPDFTMQVGGGAALSPYSIATALPPGFMGLRIVPFISLAERYDSNVFFSPVLPGLRREDYVTTFNPGIFFLHNHPLINTSLQLATRGEYFVIHPGLSYAGFNGTVTFMMNELARRVVAPGSSFVVSQNINYSPSLPGFTAGEQNTATTATTEIDTTTALVRSTALFRVNTLSATTTVGGAVPLSSSVLFQANYGYSLFRFGDSSLNEEVGGNRARTINSTAHSAQAGPAWRVTSSDTLSLRGVFENADYGGGQGGYQAIGASVGWHKVFSPFFTARVHGGATRVDQDFSGALGNTQSSEGVAYTGGAAVTYADGPQMLTLSYAVGLAPSFIAAVGPLQSHVVHVTAGRRLTELLSITGGFTYNRSEAIESTVQLPGTFFESYSGYGGVNYRISRQYFATVNYIIGTYRGNYFTPEVIAFGRNAVTFAISAYWF